jgi:hypothetical protein
MIRTIPEDDAVKLQRDMTDALIPYFRKIFSLASRDRKARSVEDFGITLQFMAHECAGYMYKFVLDKINPESNGVEELE